MEKNTRKRKIMVIGHKNPDTDSICAAISYSYLKNKISDTYHEPRRAGEINQETAFVLQKFGMPTPRLCENVSPQVRDIDIREVEGVAGGTTMRAAWETMRDKDVTSLPILNEDEHLLGLVTLQDIAMANMDSLDPRTISNAGTSLRNVIDTLDGNLVVGDPETRLSGGKVVIGAGSPDVLEQSMDEGDIVLLANRYDTQLCAIEMNAALIIICGAPDVAKTIVKLATMNSCAIITTPYDTYQASFLLNQSIPVEHFMQRNIKSFSLLTTVEDARKLMGQVRYNYFPIVNGDGKYCGLISKRNLLNFMRKKLILVDHNERTQCVDGYEEAEILEIIDHHRIGTLETNGPVYFRNQPVGCTNTIIYSMFREQGVEIEPAIAGIMCCAILSDTLAFRSPTCTQLD
ncbi:MAG: putative manganese-dependent inorganic diphosphatase, partial [Oscillospiraceae bacterium]|nr:putative manganese-dependent inorganic diphosphatase [Oscillospiraceae bacterium]